MLAEAAQDVHERVAHSSRRRQCSSVPAIGPETTSSKDQAVHPSRDSDRQTAHSRRQRALVGSFDEQVGFVSFISWSGLDIGRDRGSPVSHYEAPFAFTGKLRKVTFVLDDDQVLDAKAAAEAVLARE